MRTAQYADASWRLHDHLLTKMSPSDGYPDPPSWGYAFSLLLSAALGKGRLTNLGNASLDQLARQDHHHPNYSWEFVVYAVQQTKRLLPPGTVLPCDVHRRKGTRMLNWFLLRQVNQGWFGGSNSIALLKLRAARHLYTTPQGQLLDEFRTRSLQYHAFCLFLLCELTEQHPAATFIKQWLTSGVQLSASMVLSDGTALWLGRGQEQIFGYGALLYALEYVHRRVEPMDPTLLNRVADHVLSFQRADGSFPLVLRKRCAELPGAVFRKDKPPGWYGYNTLYDYQPFLGYLLWRTAELKGIT